MMNVERSIYAELLPVVGGLLAATAGTVDEFDMSTADEWCEVLIPQVDDDPRRAVDGQVTTFTCIVNVFCSLSQGAGVDNVYRIEQLTEDAAAVVDSRTFPMLDHESGSLDQVGLIELWDATVRERNFTTPDGLVIAAREIRMMGRATAWA